MEDQKIYVEMEERCAMIRLPSNAVSVSINVVVYDNGELVKVSKSLTLEDIRFAFQDADDNYYGEDYEYVLTDKGLKFAEQLRERENSGKET